MGLEVFVMTFLALDLPDVENIKADTSLPNTYRPFHALRKSVAKGC